MTRILMVSPYPPIRDGIGTYAAQEVKRLLLDGHDVEVLSPQPSAAHHHLALRSPRGVAALAKRVRDYDRVIVQYHPDVFYPHPVGPAAKAAISAALVGMCVRGGNVELRLHEFKPEWGGRGPEAELMRRVWLAAKRLEVHTETEREQLCAAYRLPPDRVHVVEHGAHFEAHVAKEDRAAIRAALGIAEGEHCFLSIGFLQPHKGFDRSIRAFARLGTAPGAARLDVVGGLRMDDDGYVAHVEDLKDLAAATPGATVHAGFVSDRRFDEWILAADTIVLPYRTIWSSGVVERARLYGTPVIATRVGGLEEQASDVASFVDTDDELVEAMADALGRPRDEAAAHTTAWQPIVAAGDVPDRARIQAELRARAGVRTEIARPAPGTVRRRSARTARLAMPKPESPSLLGRAAKKLIHRLTYWEVAPIVHHVNELQRALEREQGTANDAPPSDKLV